MARNSREFGEQLEAYILSYIKELWPESHLTSNSGAVHGDGDISGPHYYWDGKNSDKKGFSIPYDEWAKAKKQARENDKIPLLVRSNFENDICVQVGFDDFMELLWKAYGGDTE